MDAFSPDKRTASGLKSWCKPCCRAANREHYQRNRDKKAAYGAANKDRKREYDRQYAEQNREKRAQQRSEYGPGYYQRLRNGEHTATARPLLEQVGYKGAHSRLFRQRGLASAHLCVACGQPATDWSYNYTDPGAAIEPEGRHKGCAYSSDPMHYSPRCRSCHVAFDTAHREDDD
jgi:hypothetical protein